MTGVSVRPTGSKGQACGHDKSSKARFLFFTATFLLLSPLVACRQCFLHLVLINHHFVSKRAKIKTQPPGLFTVWYDVS